MQGEITSSQNSPGLDGNTGEMSPQAREGALKTAGGYASDAAEQPPESTTLPDGTQVFYGEMDEGQQLAWARSILEHNDTEFVRGLINLYAATSVLGRESSDVVAEYRQRRIPIDLLLDLIGGDHPSQVERGRYAAHRRTMADPLDPGLRSWIGEQPPESTTLPDGTQVFYGEMDEGQQLAWARSILEHNDTEFVRGLINLYATTTVRGRDSNAVVAEYRLRRIPIDLLLDLIGGDHPSKDF